MENAQVENEHEQDEQVKTDPKLGLGKAHDNEYVCINALRIAEIPFKFIIDSRNYYIGGTGHQRIG
jgi:hypothetical protein